MDQNDLDPPVGATSDRRPRPWWPVVAAVVTTLAVAGLFVALQHHGDSGPSSAGTGTVALPTPRTIVKDGVTFHVRPTTAVAVAPDPSDPSVVTLYARDLYQAESPKCSWFRPTARVVSQGAGGVRIATFDYEVPGKRRATFTCAAISEDNENGTTPYGFAALRVRLDAPWDGRPVTDVTSGKVIGSVPDLVAPAPGYLPAGFHARTYPAGYQPDPSALHNNFLPYRTYERGRSSLEVFAASSTYVMYAGKPVGHDDVSGSRATIAETDYQRCVTWSSHPGVTLEVCSQGGEFLPASELLTIARSIDVAPAGGSGTPQQ